MTHRQVELRTLAMHREIARKFAADPESVLAIARANLDRWKPTAGRSAPYHEEWRRLLLLDLPQLARRIQEDSEEMTALRQSNPFAGVLTPRERWRILDEATARAHHPGVVGDRG